LTQRLLWLLCLFLLAPSLAATEFRWVATAQDPGEAEAELRFTPVGGAADRVRPSPIHRVAREGQVVDVDLPPGTYWQLHLRADGWWAPPRIVEALPEGERATIEAWPTAWFEGTVSVEEGQVPPELLRLRFEPSGGDEGQGIEGRHEIACPVEEGRFVCAPPVGRFDLRLRAEGFVSHYFWDLPLTGEPYAVAPVHLEAGASAVGVVALPAGADQRQLHVVPGEVPPRRWWSETRTLEDASEALVVALPYHRLEAQVLLGDEPLPGAEVTFTSQAEDGLGGERIGARTNEDGKVFVFLPTRPAWRAEVRSDEPRIGKVFEDLVPVKEPGWDWHRWTLRLPDGRLTGKVVRSDAGPVEGARLRLVFPEDERVESHAHGVDADGAFDIRALPPGHLTLQAFRWLDGRWSSRQQDVTVTEGDNGPVELILRPSRRLEGQVIGPGGVAVLGAQLDAVLLDRPPGALPLDRLTTHTGASGEFSLEIPAESRAVGLTLRPPGFDLQQLGPFDPADSPVLLEVGQIGGTLRVDGIPVGGDPRTRPRPMLFGAYRMGLLELTSWARAFGDSADLTGDEGTLEIPRLAPGAYYLCSGPALLLWNTAPLGSPEHACIGGELAPYGDLTLTVPSSAAAPPGSGS
jgi:hypothetical protein